MWNCGGLPLRAFVDLRKAPAGVRGCVLRRRFEPGWEQGGGVAVRRGKTVVAIGTLATVKTHTLILTTNTVALRQWKSRLIDKTTLTEDEIGEYSGETKTIKPVTLATYQVLTWKSKDGPFLHFDLFDKGQWGLVIYDEVHLLPAPVFRATASLQARRRLGLTATLVREDAREDDVFSLIGPKKYDVPWKVLEKQGWIATAICTEIRIRLPEHERYNYAISPKRTKFRIASCNGEDPDVRVADQAPRGRQRADHRAVPGPAQELSKEFDAPLLRARRRMASGKNLSGVSARAR